MEEMINYNRFPFLKFNYDCSTVHFLKYKNNFVTQVIATDYTKYEIYYWHHLCQLVQLQLQLNLLRNYVDNIKLHNISHNT